MKDIKIDADLYSLTLSHISANPLPNQSTLGNLTTTTAPTKEELFNYNYYNPYPYPYYYQYPHLVNSTVPTTETTTTTSTGDFIYYNNNFDQSNLFYLDQHPYHYIMSHEPDLHHPHGQSGKKARKNNQKQRQSRCFSAEQLLQQEENFPSSSSSSSPIIKQETIVSTSSPSSSPSSSSSSSPNLSSSSFLFHPFSPSTIEQSSSFTVELSYQHQRLQQLQQQHQQLQNQQQQLSSSASSSASSASSSPSSLPGASSPPTTTSPSPSLFYREIIKEMELELDHLKDELHIFSILMDGLKTTFLEKDGFYRTLPSGSLRLSQPQQHFREMEKERRIAYDNLVQDIGNVERKFESLLIKLDTLRRMDHHFE